MTSSATTAPATPNILARYRWELLLLLVIPAIAEIARPVAATAAFIGSDSVGVLSPSAPFYIGLMGALMAKALILLAVLGRVRRQQRRLLTIIYLYSIAASLIDIPLILGQWVASEILQDSGIALRSVPLFFELVVALPVTLWFARRASGIGLVYAYFMVLIERLAFSLATPGGTATLLLEGYTDLSVANLFFLTTFLSCFATIILALVGVWLLGNFEGRGASFRTRTVVALYAYVALTYLGVYPIIWLSLLWGDFGSLPIAFVLAAAVGLVLGFEIWLIYLVRIRRPAIVSAP